jgi:hypothetical protein
MYEFPIVRTTFFDRAALLKLSLEYQHQSEESDSIETFIFVDPHPEYKVIKEYDYVIESRYKRINWSINQGKYCWYSAVDSVFQNTNAEYILSIEDDIIISKDYIKICKQIIKDQILETYKDILYFHIGAWIKPFGDKNKIVRSKASSRSILINRDKFNIITEWIKNNPDIIDNDHMISDILKYHNMTTIAPKMNRHGHFGIYGWSAAGKFKDQRGQSSIFTNQICFNDLYNLLSKSCLSGEKLLELNGNKNSQYFWDFDPNIQYNNLIYEL